MAWVEIMLPSARTLPTGKLTQNPIRTGKRRCIWYVGDDSGITLARDHATHPWTISRAVSMDILQFPERVVVIGVSADAGLVLEELSAQRDRPIIITP